MWEIKILNKFFIYLFLLLISYNLSSISIQNVLKTKIKITNSYLNIELDHNKKYEISDLNDEYNIPFNCQNNHTTLIFKFVNLNSIDHSKIVILNILNSTNQLIIKNLPKNVKVIIDNPNLTITLEVKE